MIEPLIHDIPATADARIAALEAELNSLFRARRGRAVANSALYWCSNCGQHTVNPHDGEDACRLDHV
jgi:hypothetical protein